MRMSDPSLFDDIPDSAFERDVSRRSALLRLLVEDFVRDKERRSNGQIKQFEELMLNMLDQADTFTRATFAHQLAPRADAPHSIMMRLARDEDSVAEPVILHSPVLSMEDLHVLAQEGQVLAHSVLAQRTGKIMPEEETIILEETQPTAPAMPPQQHLSDAQLGKIRALLHDPRTARSGQIMRQLLCATVAMDVPLAAQPDAALPQPHFAQMEENERLAFLRDFGATYAEQMPPLALPAFNEELMADLTRLAALRQRAELTQRLGQALAVPQGVARQIMDDVSGELFVLAARILSLPEATLTRILLLTNVSAAKSLDKLRALRDLYKDVHPAAAVFVLGELMQQAQAMAHERHAHHTPVLAVPPAKSTAISHTAPHHGDMDTRTQAISA